MTLAVYDMDKTITKAPSFLPWLFFFARTEAPLRLLLAPFLLLPLAGYLVHRDRGRLKQAMHAMMMGRRVPAATVARAAAAFADQFGRRQALPGALAKIAADKTEGFTIVMATASSEYYARALAARFGIQHVVATKNRWDGDCLLPELDGENCYGAAKLSMLKAFFAAAGFPEPPTRTRFASDHISDLPCLLWADEPLAANPSPALKQEALSRGWPVVFWA